MIIYQIRQNKYAIGLYHSLIVEEVKNHCIFHDVSCMSGPQWTTIIPARGWQISQNIEFPYHYTSGKKHFRVLTATKQHLTLQV